MPTELDRSSESPGCDDGSGSATDALEFCRLFRFVIDRKFTISLSTIPGFFSNWVTWPNLSTSGNLPSENERLASVTINVAKTLLKLLSIIVGMKSSGDCFRRDVADCPKALFIDDVGEPP